MANGYMGRMLWVNLSTHQVTEEALDEKLCRDFMGGYGLGGRILFSRQKAKADALGPDNILGFVTGPLTGTPALFGTRFFVVAKSPLTGTWGDANSGGDFGPYLKFSGYDAVFFTGVSDKPVYLSINNGQAELKDASNLWGKDTHETEDLLKNELGKETRVACIGQSGEKLSLISCVVTNKGRAAARSGIGAVMGSKKLKAVAVNGTQQVPLADKRGLEEARKTHLKALGGGAAYGGVFYEMIRDYGTCELMPQLAKAGDTPMKNWGGSVLDLPNVDALGGEAVVKLQQKKYACWRCPVGCGGIMKASTGEHKYEAGVHKPEYETLGTFGTLCLNDNLESIVKANDICNRYGLDSISAGATIAFAIECYENELISSQDTNGIQLTWGNHRSIVAMLDKLARRDGFGNVLADGAKVAASKIGKGAEKYAIHVQGQEVAMHDPKLSTRYGSTYKEAPTPGRHTCGSEGVKPPGLDLPPFDAASFTGRAPAHRLASNIWQSATCAGLCMFGYICMNMNTTIEFLSLATGWDIDLDEMAKTGERIVNIRQAFNIREGLNPAQFQLPDRLVGNPPLKEGPIAGKTCDIDLMTREYNIAQDWDPATAKPSKGKLEELGLSDVAKSLYPTG
ncbi:MAG: aldehyde ferredoxin oxidoreductase family protein [Chloroflexi bacterium]|nr:aldehyde ferredoxin oxidoreductase family protein [Chloroflexota bacterium]